MPGPASQNFVFPGELPDGTPLEFDQDFIDTLKRMIAFQENIRGLSGKEITHSWECPAVGGCR